MTIGAHFSTAAREVFLHARRHHPKMFREKRKEVSLGETCTFKQAHEFQARR